MRRRGNRIAAVATVLVFCAVSAAHVSAADPAASTATETGSPRAALLRAVDDALAGQRYVEAEALLDRLAKQAGDNSGETGLMRAEWLIAVGRPAEAAPLLASINPDERWQCRKLSAEITARVRILRLDGADQLATSGEKACGEDPVFWRSAGRLHLARDRAPAAVAAFRKSLSLDPANGSVRGDLGVALIAAGDAPEAARVLSALLLLDPDQTEARINLDYANGMLGRQPSRRPSDSDLVWSRRLQYAGLGAQRASHSPLAEALLGQALIARPRHDEQLWRQYGAVTGRDDEGRVH
ncbi:MAG: tetratricopeptide repeat protein [Sphingopyxis sp.]|nr:tetratricopeptide repeat protein [Sphingopyxis sp.]